MVDLLFKEKCVGCMACSNACPTSAIGFYEDHEGFLYPKIHKDQCISCNKCELVCPVLTKKKDRPKLKYMRVYAAWSKNNAIRLDSTSGGVFSELSYRVLDNGGVVVGAVYNKDWSVMHVLTNRKNDIKALRSSKYVQSSTLNIFTLTKKHLIEKKQVLFCGTPCQIAGLYSFLGKEFDNLITCDFICRGVNSPKVFQKYIHWLENKYQSKVRKVKFKNKTYGWHWFSTKIWFENGRKYIRDRYNDVFVKGYLEYNYFMRPSCYNCQFKDKNQVSDITLGDFWGVDKSRLNLDDDRGVSIVMIRTERGRQFFEQFSSQIFYTRNSLRNVEQGNACYSTSPDSSVRRKEFFQALETVDFDTLVESFIPGNTRMLELKYSLKRLGYGCRMLFNRIKEKY